MNEQKMGYLAAGLCTLGTGLKPDQCLANGDTAFVRVVARSLFQSLGAFASVALTSLGSGFVVLAVSLFLMQILDSGSLSPGYTLLVSGLGILLTALLELATRKARGNAIEWLAVDMDGRLSRCIFDRLFHIRPDMLSVNHGALLKQVCAYEDLCSFYATWWLLVLIDIPVSLFFTAVLVFVISPGVALVPLTILALAVISGARRRRQTPVEGCAWDAGEMEKSPGASMIGAQGITTIEDGRQIQKTKTLLSFGEKGDKVPAACPLPMFSHAAVVLMGAVLVVGGGITEGVGVMVACAILARPILAPFFSLPYILVLRGRAKIALEGLHKLYVLPLDRPCADEKA